MSKSLLDIQSKLDELDGQEIQIELDELSGKDIHKELVELSEQKIYTELEEISRQKIRTKFGDLNEDVITQIVEYLNPVDLVHLICSSSRFKQCFDRDLMWTQFCLTASLFTQLENPKNVFKTFTLKKPELKNAFSESMLDLFPNNLLARLPKHNIEFDPDSTTPLSYFNELGMIFINGSAERSISLLIENRRTFIDRPPVTIYGHYNIASYDLAVLNNSRIVRYLRLVSAMAGAYSSHFVHLNPREDAQVEFIRKLLEKYNEYCLLNETLELFIEDTNLTDLIQEYEGRDGRLNRSNIRELFPELHDALPLDISFLYKPRDDFYPMQLEDSACRIAPKRRC